MASTKLCLIFLFTLSLCSSSYVNGAGRHHHAAAPAPSVDCSQLILNMADCLSFVQNGSIATKPEGSCCSGLKVVLDNGPICLCEAFKSSAQFGVVLNVTKALTLPSACKIHAPSASNCGLGLPPAGSPESSAAGPTVSGGANEHAPAPSPGASGSHGLVISAGSLVIGLVVASFSSF